MFKLILLHLAESLCRLEGRLAAWTDVDSFRTAYAAARASDRRRREEAGVVVAPKLDSARLRAITVVSRRSR